MMWKTFLIAVFFTTVRCLPFDLKWRVEKLEEKHFRDMMDLKDGLDMIVDMVNHTKTGMCQNNGVGQSDRLGLKYDSIIRDSIDNKITQQVAEAFTVIKRAFAEEKRNIRKTLEEINHVNQNSELTITDKIDSVRSEIMDEVNGKLTSLQNLKAITDSCAKQINQLSDSAPKVAEDLSSIRQILTTNQHSIEQLMNAVNDIKPPNKAHAWFSEPTQNPKWQSVVSKTTKLQCHKQSCYFIGQNATWNESKELCGEFGAKLAEVESEEENQFLINFAAYQTDGISDVGVYLGASDLHEEGTWRWTASNRTVDDTYRNFKATEPNGKTKENCLHLYRQARWKWNDTNCTRRMGFICEVAVEI